MVICIINVLYIDIIKINENKRSTYVLNDRIDEEIIKIYM